MSYRDRRRPGSFRGVAFATPSSEREGGRRGKVHEYPGRDKHTTQDLGKAASRFTVTAVIFGEDYDIQRDRLIEALEKGGPARLVHRYFGEMQAEVEPGKTYRLVETEDQGRVATFTIPFIRAGEASVPTITIDSAEKVRKAAVASKAASVASFAKKVNASGPEFVRNQLLGTITKASNVVASVNDRVSATLAFASPVPGVISALGNNVASLVASPTKVTQLANDIYGIQEAFFGAIAAVGAAFLADAEFLGITNRAKAQTDARKVATASKSAQDDIATGVSTGNSTISPASTFGAQMAANQTAVIDLVKQSAAIEAAAAAVSIPYDSYTAAIDMRDRLDDALSSVAQGADDDVFQVIEDLRVDVNAHLTQAAGTLPRLRTYMPPITLPALLIAHQQHGDARRYEEIVARNNIRHPGFVMGARPIQVIADA